MTTRANTSTRPITRTPAVRPPHVPAGQLRIMTALRCWRHQLRPGAVETLAFVEWADLADERDPTFLAVAVRTRLGLREYSRHLVGRFDPLDFVGPPPIDQPTDRPKAAPAALRALSSPPVGLELEAR